MLDVQQVPQRAGLWSRSFCDSNSSTSKRKMGYRRCWWAVDVSAKLFFNDTHQVSFNFLSIYMAIEADVLPRNLVYRHQIIYFVSMLNPSWLDFYSSAVSQIGANSLSVLSTTYTPAAGLSSTKLLTKYTRITLMYRPTSLRLNAISYSAKPWNPWVMTRLTKS